MDENEEVTQQALIQQAVLEAEAAVEPGEMKAGQVLHEGDEELDAPMVALKPKSAGYVYIYDTRTGDRSVCNRNMLKQHLEKKRTDGSLVFTVVDPHITQKRGRFKCLLHPEGPNREHYDELGLPVCRKSNLTSPFQVARHMRKRHPVEWETIEEERKTAERIEEREDRRVQREMLSLAIGEKVIPLPVETAPEVVPDGEAPFEEVPFEVGTQEAPLYVSEKPPKEKKPRRKRKK